MTETNNKKRINYFISEKNGYNGGITQNLNKQQLISKIYRDINGKKK